MWFNIAQLLKEPIGSTRGYEIDETAALSDVGTRQVSGQVKLIRTDRGILARAELELTVDATCSRCLNPSSLPIRVQIEEVYYPTIDIHSGASLPPPPEPGNFTVDDTHLLDLSEAVRQYTLLAMPMKPLCRSDCAGLCVRCGHNLNLGPCHCLPQSPDPRRALLEKLR